MRRAPSLRNAYLLLGAGLSSLALLLTGALLVSVIWLTTLSSDLRRTLAADREAMRIQFQLFRAARSYEIFGETGDPEWRNDAQASEARLVASIARMEEIPLSPRAAAAFAHLEATIDQLRRDVFDASPGQRVIRLGDFIAAYADASAFLDVIADDAARQIDDASRWSRLAIVLAAIAIFVMLASLPLAIRFTRRAVYLPIVRLRRALQMHASDRTVLAPEAGPVEFRAIGRDVNELFERLESQRERQLTFLASIAHDLRNPMAALRTSAQLAERRAETEPQRKSAERVLRQIDRMNRLVTDLLDVSRIEAGQFELAIAPTDLRVVVRDTCELYAGTSAIHAVRCSVPASPVRADVDPTRISQVLGNLVSNAIKYSPEGSPVDVRLAAEDGWAIVEVEDRGMGIPPEDHERVFEAFRRSKGADASIPGVGLGLSVARRLVRAHHGEIELESAVGVGSTFRVRLPLSQ